jgi:hypothetical protein
MSNPDIDSSGIDPGGRSTLQWIWPVFRDGHEPGGGSITRSSQADFCVETAGPSVDPRAERSGGRSRGPGSQGPARFGLCPEQPKHFTDEEIWLLNLAVDVVAMLGTLAGVASSIRKAIITDLGSLDEHVVTDHWKQAVRKADPGPPEFHDLRALVPHHKPAR